MRAFQLVDISFDPLHYSLRLKSIDSLFLEAMLICHLFDIFSVKSLVVCLSFLAHFEEFVDVPSEFVTPKHLFIDDDVFDFDR